MFDWVCVGFTLFLHGFVVWFVKGLLCFVCRVLYFVYAVSVQRPVCFCLGLQFGRVVFSSGLEPDHVLIGFGILGVGLECRIQGLIVNVEHFWAPRTMKRNTCFVIVWI